MVGSNVLKGKMAAAARALGSYGHAEATILPWTLNMATPCHITATMVSGCCDVSLMPRATGLGDNASCSFSLSFYLSRVCSS